MGFLKSVKNVFSKQPKESTTERNRIDKRSRAEETNGNSGRRQGAGMRQLRLIGDSVKVTNNGSLTMCVDGMVLAPGQTFEMILEPSIQAVQGGPPVSSSICASAQVSFDDFMQAIQRMPRGELITLMCSMRMRTGEF